MEFPDLTQGRCREVGDMFFYPDSENEGDTSIANLIDGAPSTLDTLNEIAAALADTANFSDTVVLKSGSTMTGNLAMGTNKVTGLGTPTTSTDAARRQRAGHRHVQHPTA